MTTDRVSVAVSYDRVCHRGYRLAQRGVGLIEVLVAVLLLSIAFLGVAALQAKALSTNNSAMARSMATMASYSILDAMRADHAAAVDGSYNIASSINASACPAANTTLASAQLHDWCVQLGQVLGQSENTTGHIHCENVHGYCTVIIGFDDSRAGKGGASEQVIVTKSAL